MAKRNGFGGSNDSGSPAEMPAAEVQQPPIAAETSTDRPMNVAGQHAEVIQPDQQAASGPASGISALSTEALKMAWGQARSKIDDADNARAAIRPIEQELCERVKAIADAQKIEAVIVIGERRVKVKARPAKHGGGLHLVDAPINAAIEL